MEYEDDHVGSYKVPMSASVSAKVSNPFTATIFYSTALEILSHPLMAWHIPLYSILPDPTMPTFTTFCHTTSFHIASKTIISYSIAFYPTHLL